MFKKREKRHVQIIFTYRVCQSLPTTNKQSSPNYNNNIQKKKSDAKDIQVFIYIKRVQNSVCLI